jgi:hypothetical protein
MTQLYLTVLFLLLHLQLTTANVEKVIFLGPSSLQIPIQKPTLEGLQLHTLSPQNGTIRTKLRAEFPTNTSIWGESSWILLEKLAEGQRYEVRICWAATVMSIFTYQRNLSNCTSATNFLSPFCIRAVRSV